MKCRNCNKEFEINDQTNGVFFTFEQLEKIREHEKQAIVERDYQSVIEDQVDSMIDNMLDEGHLTCKCSHCQEPQREAVVGGLNIQ